MLYSPAVLLSASWLPASAAPVQLISTAVGILLHLRGLKDSYIRSEKWRWQDERTSVPAHAIFVREILAELGNYWPTVRTHYPIATVLAHAEFIRKRRVRCRQPDRR